MMSVDYVGNGSIISNMRGSSTHEELRRRLPEILSEGKLRWLPSGEAEFSIGGNRLQLVFSVLARPTLALLRDLAHSLEGKRSADRLQVISAPHLNEEMRQLCQKLEVNYLDLSGNAWIQRDPVVIRKEVAKNLYPHEAKERSPFADRASRVLRYLLGRSVPLGVRRIAAATGLDPGYVSRVLRAASGMGYVAVDSDGQAKIRNHEELLADWSSFYSWRRNEVQGFHYLGPPGSELDVQLEGVLRALGAGSYALTLHAGNNRIEPFVDYSVAHLYVGEKAGVVERLVSQLQLRPVPVAAANVVLATPYYRDSAFFEARQVGGLWVASDLQLYLDLRRFPIRGLESAERILEQRLRPLWGAAV
jgi:hypothetical protein